MARSTCDAAVSSVAWTFEIRPSVVSAILLHPLVTMTRVTKGLFVLLSLLHRCFAGCIESGTAESLNLVLSEGEFSDTVTEFSTSESI